MSILGKWSKQNNISFIELQVYINLQLHCQNNIMILNDQFYINLWRYT